MVNYDKPVAVPSTLLTESVTVSLRVPGALIQNMEVVHSWEVILALLLPGPGCKLIDIVEPSGIMGDGHEEF